MSDETAPLGGTETVVSVPVATPADKPITASEAARQLANWRYKQNNPEPEKTEEPAAPAEAAAEPPKELAEEPSSDPETAPAETTPEAEPALPPIDPPRSWTKEEKEEFATYPREAQEKIARREQDRETALRRSQNEAADKLKGLSAKEQAAEQARQRYEEALPQLLSTLQEQQQGEFKDIRTMADVEKLAREDWPRYALWDAQQKKIAAVYQEVQASQERQAQEQSKQWGEFLEKENSLAEEKFTEIADKATVAKLRDQVVPALERVGFKKDDFAGFARGEKISPFDHRWQQIVAKATLYDQAKAGITKPAAKPIPPVQRPGTSKAPTSAADAELQNLQKSFERKPDAKNAAALLNARRRSA